MSDVQVLELLPSFRAELEMKAVEPFNETVLPRLVSVAGYTPTGTQKLLLRLLLLMRKILAGNVRVEFSIQFTDQYPDVFQMAYRLILLGSAERFLPRN